MDILPASNLDDSTLPATGTPAHFSRDHSFEEEANTFHCTVGARLRSLHGSNISQSVVLELLAYILTIIKASQQYDGMYWRAYDTHYRMKKH